MEPADGPRGIRTSSPLSERDLRDLAALPGSTTYRAALSRLAHTEVTEASSEAAMLHAVLEAGIKAQQQLVESEGYAQIPAEDATEQRQAVARRRWPSWADA